MEVQNWGITKLLGLILMTGVVTAVSCTSSPELEWHEEEHYRWAEVALDYFGETGFESLNASHTNISFNNRISKMKMYLPEHE